MILNVTDIRLTNLSNKRVNFFMITLIGKCMRSLSVDNESHRNHYDVKYDSRSHALVNITLGFIVVFRNEYWSYLTTTTSECIDVEIHDVKDSE